MDRPARFKRIVVREHRKINDPVAGARPGAFAAFVLGKTLEIALLLLRFFLRAHSRFRSVGAPGLGLVILRCVLRAIPISVFLLGLLVWPAKATVMMRLELDQLVTTSDVIVVATVCFMFIAICGHVLAYASGCWGW